MAVVRYIKPNSMTWPLFLAGTMMLLVYTFARRTNWPECGAHVLPVEHMGVFSEADLRRFLQTVRNKSVVRVESSGLGGCKAKRNLIMTVDDGSTVFVRWRNKVTELPGELYAYYLNCYLGLWNAPPTALLCVNPSTEWRGVIKDIPLLKEQTLATYFVSSQYVQGLKYGPYPPLSLAIKSSTTHDELKYLMQWSDMIVFDYICGHVDRMTINLFLPPLNLELNWKRVRNLAYTGAGDLILIDNETAFRQGYEKAEHNSVELSWQAHYFRKLSVFRKSTAERICNLCQYKDPALVLEEYIKAYDPVSYSIVSKLTTNERHELKRRLLTVCDVVCSLLNKGSDTHTASYSMNEKHNKF